MDMDNVEFSNMNKRQAQKRGARQHSKRLSSYDHPAFFSSAHRCIRVHVAISAAPPPLSIFRRDDKEGEDACIEAWEHMSIHKLFAQLAVENLIVATMTNATHTYQRIFRPGKVCKPNKTTHACQRAICVHWIYMACCVVKLAGTARPDSPFIRIVTCAPIRARAQDWCNVCQKQTEHICKFGPWISIHQPLLCSAAWRVCLDPPSPRVADTCRMQPPVISASSQHTRTSTRRTHSGWGGVHELTRRWHAHMTEEVACMHDRGACMHDCMHARQP